MKRMHQLAFRTSLRFELYLPSTYQSDNIIAHSIRPLKTLSVRRVMNRTDLKKTEPQQRKSRYVAARDIAIILCKICIYGNLFIATDSRSFDMFIDRRR